MAKGKHYIAEKSGLKVLKHVYGKYAFYDIMLMSGLVIRDCKLVKGKNGTFISTPARYDEDNDKYYPYVFMSDKISEGIVAFIKKAKFKLTKKTYLSIRDEDEEEEDEDEEDEEDEDEEEEEDEAAEDDHKNKSRSKARKTSKSKKSAASDDYPF